MHDEARIFTRNEIVDELPLDGEAEPDLCFIPGVVTEDDEAFTLSLKAILEQQPVSFAIGHEGQLSQVQSLTRVLNTRFEELGMTAEYRETVMGTLNGLIVDYLLRQEGEPDFERESWASRSITALLIRPAWQEEAACRGENDLFFSSYLEDVEKAEQICLLCPVRDECRDFGEDQSFGVWDGESHDALAKAAKKRNRQEKALAKRAAKQSQINVTGKPGQSHPKTGNETSESMLQAADELADPEPSERTSYAEIAKLEHFVANHKPDYQHEAPSAHPAFRKD